jgi:Na+/H+ antiporter NhaD/arsenite permease-like protein
MWAVGVGILLAMFYVIDIRNYRRAPAGIREKETGSEFWRFEGLPNLFFLAVILIAASVNRPPFLREALMLGAALGSWFTTKKDVHASNHFSFGPVKEVAILFVGIFGTMIPALDWLQANAARLREPTAGLFYFGTGALSSLLDNAPTYLCFLKAALGRFVDPAALGPLAAASPHLNSDQLQVALFLADAKLHPYLLAISIGAVFFGANTYIGNGPNFMVKAIADHQKVHTPSFLGYIWKYTMTCMLPMLVVVWWLFFRSVPPG